MFHSLTSVVFKVRQSRATNVFIRLPTPAKNPVAVTSLLATGPHAPRRSSRRTVSASSKCIY